MKRKEKFDYGFLYAAKCGAANSKNPEIITMDKLSKIKGFEEDDVCICTEPLNYTVISNSCALCMLTDLTFKTIMGDMVYSTIICDEYFKLIPGDYQLFFIYHELGHYKNNHLKDASKYNTLRRYVKLDPKEVEADLFAAKQVGKETAIKALTYIKERMPITSALEINRRIRAIEATIL